MAKGDKVNWGCVAFAIIYLNMDCFDALVPLSAAPDKYYYAMLSFISGFHAAIVTLVLVGLYSLSTRNSTPILGALCGLGGVLAFGIASAIAFIMVAFAAYWIAPHASTRPMAAVMTAFGWILPLVALAIAFLRNPKSTSSFKMLSHVPTDRARTLVRLRLTGSVDADVSLKTVGT